MKRQIGKNVLVKAFLVVTIFLFLLLTGPSAAIAGPGDLDQSFGTNGVVTTLISNVSSNARGVAIQPDGKIVVAGTVSGSSSGIFVARYNSNGSLDTSFGEGGVVTTYFGEYFFGGALVLQPDGKILVAGSVNNNSGHGIIMARYTSNGVLDTTFGTGGVVTTYLEAIYFEGSALVLQPDGNIVVAGSVENNSSHDILVARYKSDGSLDTSFGTGGLVITDIISEGVSGGDRGSAVAIQLDGKILVAGSSLDKPVYGTEYFAVVRYNSNGLLDTSFGTGGIATTHIVGSPDSRNYCWFMALQPDGKIVFGGFLNEVFSEGNDIALARYLPNGTLDSSFDGDGMVTTHRDGRFTVGFGIALQPNGKIVVTGYDAFEEGDEYKCGILVARYNEDGSLDTEFGGGGIVTTEINGGSAYGFAVAIQSDGKIVVAGGELNSSQSEISEIVVVRYIGAATLSIADISLSKGVDNIRPYVDDTIVFTVRAANLGPDDATGVMVKDILHPGLSFVSAVATQGTYDPPSGLWTVGGLKIGGSAVLTLRARVDKEGTITNTVMLAGVNEIDRNAINDTASVNLTAEYRVYAPSTFQVQRLESDLIFSKEYINRLTWAPNPLNKSIIVNYRLYRKAKGQPDTAFALYKEFAASVTSFDDRGLKKDDLFTYWLTSVNMAGKESDPVEAGN